MQTHHTANNDQRGRMNLPALDIIRKGLQGTGDHFLQIGGAPGDKRNRGVAFAAMGHQLITDLP